MKEQEKTSEEQVQERDRRTGLLGRSRKTGTEGKGIQSPVKTLCRCWWWGREEAEGKCPEALRSQAWSLTEASCGEGVVVGGTEHFLGRQREVEKHRSSDRVALRLDVLQRSPLASLQLSVLPWLFWPHTLRRG